MAEPQKLTPKEDDAIRSDYEKRYGYDSRRPEEKAAFDKKFDEHYQIDKRAIQKMTIPMNRTKKSRMIMSGNVVDVDFVK